MPTLHTVATIWIGYLVGTLTAAAFLAFSPPAPSQLLDGLLTVVAFGAGAWVGIALVRLAHSTAFKTARAAEGVREALPIG